MSHVEFKKWCPRCRISNLRNVYVPVPIFKISMSILKWFNVACRMAYVMSIVFCLVSIGSMSHVEFKKQPYRPRCRI